MIKSCEEIIDVEKKKKKKRKKEKKKKKEDGWIKGQGSEMEQKCNFLGFSSNQKVDGFHRWSQWERRKYIDAVE